MPQIQELEDEIARSLAIVKKDAARMAATPVVLIKRAIELQGDPVALGQLIIEARAIGEDYGDESGLLGDPYKDERQHLRIFAKRNGLDAGFQALIGVSDGTPADYDDAYKAKYLG